MAVAVLNTASLLGIDAHMIRVEVDMQNGLPKFDIVGLPDSTIKESKSRVVAAIKNSFDKFQFKKITINLSPANIPKFGAGFDLPIALALLIANKIISDNLLKKFIIIGELSLKGEIKPIVGVLAVAQMAKMSGYQGIICPLENAKEASLVSDIDVFYAANLHELVTKIIAELPLNKANYQNKFQQKSIKFDLVEVKGQEKAKRALEIAAAGNHHLLFVGPPGAGKTMLAKRLADILPPLNLDQALEVAKIYSSCGLLEDIENNLGVRPFREPHHTISNSGLVGGGSSPRPGEVTLAHHGTLFLDEFAEFPSNLLDLLRQPLENYYVIVSRVKKTIKFPCQFQLIAAMNPCPCGYYGDAHHKCVCKPWQISKYLAKISGPIMDRIDLHVELYNLNYEKITDLKPGLTSAQAREHVNCAIKMQTNRFNSSKRNNQLTAKEISIYCKLNDKCQEIMKKAMDRWHFSNRVYAKLLKISRTIADFDQALEIEEAHLLEAINYRYFDKKALL